MTCHFLKYEVKMGSEFTMFTVSEPTSGKIPLAHGKYSKPRNAAIVSQNTDKKYPVCDKDAYLYKTRNGQEAISKRIKDCPWFKEANDDLKKDMVKKIKTKHPVCDKYLSWFHKSQDCT